MSSPCPLQRLFAIVGCPLALFRRSHRLHSHRLHSLWWGRGRWRLLPGWRGLRRHFGHGTHDLRCRRELGNHRGRRRHRLRLPEVPLPRVLLIQVASAGEQEGRGRVRGVPPGRRFGLPTLLQQLLPTKIASSAPFHLHLLHSAGKMAT